jgi:hypothetical protein
MSMTRLSASPQHATHGRNSPAELGADMLEQSSERMDEKAAAKYLGLSVRTLQDWRSRSIGPAYLKLGTAQRSLILYTRTDLDAFAESCRVVPVGAAPGSSDKAA